MAEYINRDDLLKAAWDKPTLALSVYDIGNIKPVDVSPVRHGRWIEYTKVIIPEPYNKWEQAWRCSECGFDDGFVAYNYCPNCAAKMDLEGCTVEILTNTLTGETSVGWWRGGVEGGPGMDGGAHD